MDAVALGWANRMNENAAMSHNPDYSSQIPGGWMKSPGHRANIPGDVTDIGIAFIGVNGRPGVCRTSASILATSDRRQRRPPCQRRRPHPHPGAAASAESENGRSVAGASAVLAVGLLLALWQRRVRKSTG